MATGETEAGGEKTQDRLLRAALELFSTKGYDATSVREICEQAGVAKPTLYHFYGSKEGVYRALLDGTLARHRQEVLAAVGKPGPAVARLKAFARRYFDTTNRDARLMRFLFALIHNPPSSAPPTDFPRFYAEVVRQVAEVVDDAVARGELAAGPTGLRMLAFMGALGEAVVGFLLMGQPDLTPELADGLVDVVLQGWGPRTC